MVAGPQSNIVLQSFYGLSHGVVEYIPNLIIAILIFLFGWLAGALVARFISQVVAAFKVDNALRSAGLEDLLSRAGFRLNSGDFLGELVKWFIIVAFLVASLDVLGLNQVNIFLQEVVLLYLPQVIAAVLILLVAAVIAEVSQTVVVGAAKAADMPSAHFLGNVTRWAIWIFAFLAALNQLSVASIFVQTLFTGVVVAVSLALGLSFGLGGQDVAKHYLEKMRDEMKRR